MSSINLRITVPLCSFRKPYAREFLESEKFPPPSTVYGFLLSLVGEEDRYSYVGTKIALAMVERPRSSLILRTAWRVKKTTQQSGTGSNKRPDYQEILSGLTMGVWVEEGPLGDRITKVFTVPKSVDRFGGLSLGESRDLVNDVHFQPSWNGQCSWLICDENGPYPLPVWVDHVGSKGTRWIQCVLKHGMLEEPGLKDRRWIVIAPPDTEHQR